MLVQLPSLKEHKARRKALVAETEALRRDLAANASRLEAVAKSSLSRGLTKVLDNQRALEAETRLFKATASNLLTQTAQWASQYQAFCSDVEVTLKPWQCVGRWRFCLTSVGFWCAVPVRR